MIEVAASLHFCRPIPESSSSVPSLSPCGIPAAGRLLVCSLSLSFAELLDGDAVHVHGALLGQALAHGDAAALIRLVLGLADEAGLLELFEAVADVLTSGLLGDFLLGTAASLATVVLTKSLHSNLLSHVELVANRSCARIEPIIVQGVQLLIAGSLNGLGPLLNIILIRTGLRKESKKLIAHI